VLLIAVDEKCISYFPGSQSISWMRLDGLARGAGAVPRVDLPC